MTRKEMLALVRWHDEAKGDGEILDRHHTEAVEALRQLLDETEPRPMETAPRDGTPFLGFMPTFYQNKGGVEVCVRLDGEWITTSLMRVNPSHWWPLPKRPAVKR